MRHYVPLPTNGGMWAVAYGNHRGEYVAVMECHTLDIAYSHSAQMTAKEAAQAIRIATQAPRATSGGNRHLRRYFPNE